jgi:hypothetical protein
MEGTSVEITMDETRNILGMDFLVLEWSDKKFKNNSIQKKTFCQASMKYEALRMC